MTQGTRSVLILAAALASTPVAAQTRPGFEVGVQVFDYAYRERLDGNTIVRDDGVLGGLLFGYVETIGRGWFLRARFDAASGNVDYRAMDGARIENVKQTVSQLELQVGRDFRLGGGVTLTAFTGLASRVLDDESGGRVASNAALGYDRQIRYAYVPVGLTAGLPVGRNARLLLSGQYNRVIGGKAESKFSELDRDLPDVALDLNGGNGFEAGAMLALPLGRRAVGFGPFIRNWRIGRSDSRLFTEPEGTLELFEPSNRTTEAGLRVSFAF